MVKTIIYFSLFSLLLIGCNKDNEEPEDNTNNDNSSNEQTQSCETLPQFPDQQSENLFSSIGNSCLSNDWYENNQQGSATLLESDGNPNCSIEGIHYFKFHLGHADIDNESKTFDVDIYILSEDKPVYGDEYDLSSNDLNVYYSYFDDGVLKSAKATKGSLTLSESGQADFYGEFNFEAETFIFEQGVEATVEGNGSFAENPDVINVEGKFLAIDKGLTPDCE